MPPTLSDQRREQRVFAAAALALWALFLVQAWLSAPLLDDWVQLGWAKGRALDLGLIWQVARYNHAHFNPRLGDVFLLVVNGSRAAHLVLTPAMQLGVLAAAFVVAFGRRPRATYRDLQLLVVLQAMIWLASPIPGVVYFYRPFATNYLFGFAITLAVVAPYRLAVAGDAAPGPRWRGWLAVPAMAAAGWLAGMTNEHTGPTAIAAVIGVAIYAGRRRRLRGWMIAGALGLVVGYVMLLTAPGQAERYAGRAAKLSALGLIASRGVAGNYDVVAGFVGEAQWAIVVIVAAVLGFVHRARRAGGAVPAMARGAVIAVIAEHLLADRRLCRLLTGGCAILVAYHAVRFVEVYAAVAGEHRARMARIAAAAPGTVAIVPPLRTPRSRWYWGDDFRMAGVRAFVAHELYGLAGIEYDDRPIWAEPSPPERFVASRTYDPARSAPPAYAPPFLDAALGQLHRELAFGVPDGHRLVRYQLDVADAGLADPKHRPLRALVWEPAGVRYVDGDGIEDANHQLAIRIAAASAPAGWTDAYVVGCGETARIEPRIEPAPPHDLIVPLELACRGSYTAVICDAEVCWFAGRFWR